jgi:hypothetical protein
MINMNIFLDIMFNFPHSNMSRLLTVMIPLTKEFSDHLITWGSYADRFAARSRCPWQIDEEFSKVTIIGDITPLPVEHKRGDQASGTMGMLTMPYKCWGLVFEALKTPA